MEELFRKAQQLIASERFADLRKLEVKRPEHFNWVKEVFEAIQVKDQPDGLALLWTDGQKINRYTYQQMSFLCNRFLNLLRKKGIQPKDLILTQLALQPANWIAMLAAIKGGFPLIPAANMLSVQDLVYRFQKLHPRVIISDNDDAPKIDEALALYGSDSPLKIIVDGDRDGWLSFSELENESREATATDTASQDPLFLFFTSGTTDMPKIVVHTHLNYPVGHLTTASWIGLRKGDLHYNIAKPGWGKFIWSSFFAPWTMGASVFAFAQKGHFNAHEQLSMMEKFKVTTFCAPPTALRMLIREDLKAYHLSLRQCVAAGEPLNGEVIRAWEEGTGLLIRDGYGQTESTCLIANLPGTKIKPGSMGRPTFLYDIIVADENGQELPADKEGFLAVKLADHKVNGLFSDYLGDSEKKKLVFRNGMYYTGDKAYRDGDGYIFFIGRNDDVIKTSDYRVGPFEVESVLVENEAVVESAVVGSPHPLKTQEVKAFIILAASMKPTEKLADEIFSFCRARLAPYKMPRIIEFVRDLPKTISGKIRRVELRAEESLHKSAGHPGKFEYFYKSSSRLKLTGGKQG